MMCANMRHLCLVHKPVKILGKVEEKADQSGKRITIRHATRIYLFENFERWRTLLNDTGLAKDKDLAKLLMDFYDT